MAEIIAKKERSMRDEYEVVVRMRPTREKTEAYQASAEFGPGYHAVGSTPEDALRKLADHIGALRGRERRAADHHTPQGGGA